MPVSMSGGLLHPIDILAFDMVATAIFYSEGPRHRGGLDDWYRCKMWSLPLNRYPASRMTFRSILPRNAARAVVVAALMTLSAVGISTAADQAAACADGSSCLPAPEKTNCAARPSLCGYPDETNTGIKDGITLKRIPDDVRKGQGWHWDERGWVSIDQPNTEFRDYQVNATIDVVASNVRISNVKVTVGGETFGIALRSVSNVTIENCEIGPSDSDNRLMVGIKDIYGDSKGTLIARSNIYHVSTAIQLHEGYIHENFIHSLAMVEGDHLNGIMSNGGTSLLEIKRNTILNSHAQTDAVALFQDFGVQGNRNIEGNLLAGGAYVIYGGHKEGSETFGIKIVGNRISRMYFSKGGFYGHATAFAPGGRGNIWSDNVWDETNQLVPIP